MDPTVIRPSKNGSMELDFFSIASKVGPRHQL